MVPCPFSMPGDTQGGVSIGHTLVGSLTCCKKRITPYLVAFHTKQMLGWPWYCPSPTSRGQAAVVWLTTQLSTRPGKSRPSSNSLTACHNKGLTPHPPPAHPKVSTSWKQNPHQHPQTVNLVEPTNPFQKAPTSLNPHPDRNPSNCQPHGTKTLTKNQEKPEENYQLSTSWNQIFDRNRIYQLSTVNCRGSSRHSWR